MQQLKLFIYGLAIFVLAGLIFGYSTTLPMCPTITLTMCPVK